MVCMMVKMKVKMIAGKIYLPKEVRKKVNLSEKGECEVVVVGDEIRIRPVQPETLNTLEHLKKPKREMSIEDMVEAEAVEDA